MENHLTGKDPARLVKADHFAYNAGKIGLTVCLNLKKEKFMSELSFHIQIRRKGNWFLASAPELDFVSQGETLEEARKNLLEVIKIQFEEMREMGTLEEYLAECGFVAKGDRMVPQSEFVRFEESTVSVG